MALVLLNTLGRAKQEFTPIRPSEVSMYSCGPTVYNVAHVGNLRAYVFADVLKRTLEYNGYKVKHVMNVTDIGHLTSDADDGEDKMVKALKREGKPMTLEAMREVADFYFEKFRSDLNKLNIEEPDEFPFASDHIPEMVSMIQKLLDKSYAYELSDGIYFDTSKLSGYGRLGGVSEDNLSRIAENSEKRNQKDFALWKFSNASGIGFDAPTGLGFPGWHIECSAMSEKYLGVPFDIHTGGIDHIPVHHNNEIAQTEAATGMLLANYWLHNEHLTIGEEKMAKSGGSIATLDTLSESGVHSLAFRYWLLTARYSTRMDYSIEAILAAQTAYEKLQEHFGKLVNDEGVIDGSYKDKFTLAINNDLDTPGALALVWELVKDKSVADADKRSTLLDFDRVLGLMIGHVVREVAAISPEVQSLLDERQIARDAKDWVKSDELRMQINSAGFDVKDTDEGQKLTKL